MLQSIKDFWFLIVKTIKFEIFYKFGIILIIAPLFNKIIQVYLNAKGDGGAFNHSLLFDFMSLEGVLILIFLFALALIVVVYEISVIINLVTLSYRQVPFRIYEVMKASLLNLKCLKAPSSILAVLYFVLLLPLVRIGYLNSLLPSLKIPNFIFGELKLTAIGNLLSMLIYIIYHGLYLLLFFIPFIMVLKKVSFYQAFKINLNLHWTMKLRHRLLLVITLISFAAIKYGLDLLLPNAIIKNSDFNRFFLRNLLISSQFRTYIFQYLVYSLIMILMMVIFYRIIIIIVAGYDNSLVRVQIDQDFSKSFDNTLLSAKIHGSKIYRFFNLHIFKTKFYQKYWGIINIVFWTIVLLVTTYLFPNSIYLMCMLLIVAIIMYFIASIINHYDKKRHHQDAKENNSWLFLPYRIINNFLNQSKIYNRHPKIVSVILIVILSILIGAYLEPTTILHQPWVIGHRGSRYGVENCYEAIVAADKYKTDYVEIDVQLSGDKKVVVVHDNDLSRLSGKEVRVNQTTAKELQQLQLSQNGYTGTIDTLEQLIKKMKKDQLEVGLLIELKTDYCDGEILTKKVIEIIEDNKFAKQTIFMSLDYHAVSLIQEAHPEWWVGYCVYGSVGDVDISLWNMNVDFLAVEENRATVNFIEKANYNVTPVYVWTVDQPKKMQQYLNMGVSGIITNYPDLGYEAINSYLNQKYRYYYYQGSGYPKYEY